VADNRVRYARSGDAHIAYRAWGSGEPTIVITIGLVVVTIETVDQPGSPYLSIVEGLAAHRRLVLCERRGHGMSDPVTHVPTLDERVADLRAVIDAAGVDKLVLVGSGEAGPLVIRFATDYPERVTALALVSTAARFTRDPPEHPWGFSEADVDRQLHDIDQNWGEGALSELFFGAMTEMPGVRAEFGKLQRSVCSPAQARLLWRSDMAADVRDLLPRIQMPTIVMARPTDEFIPFEASAALAAAIPGAVLCTLPPGPHLSFDIGDVFVSEFLEFIGERPAISPIERELITVMFTDIVSSTERVSARGDADWRRQLDMHDSVVDTILGKHGGVRAKHTGDGVFAVFTGPSKAARCALELVTALGTRGIPIRVGVHIGECERRGDDWSGLAVHVGARIGAMAGPGEVLASRTVRDLSAGSGLEFEGIGVHQLKGLAEEVALYRVRAQPAR
jgi:class 3 adenylate cyclase/pimeloyl-ACP methyl ester carboxylesterase